MAFAFNALILYMPNKGSLKWGFSALESMPFVAAGLPAATVDGRDVRPLMKEPVTVPTTDGGVLTVKAWLEDVSAWRPSGL